MFWYIPSGEHDQQHIPTRFSMNMWSKLAKRNTYLPVTVDASNSPQDIQKLSRLLPADSFPYIKAIFISLTSSQFLTDFYTFLARFEELQSLSITIVNISRPYTAWPPLPLVFSVTHPDISGLSSLRSINLSGLWFQQRDLYGIRLSSITSLSITDLPRAGEDLPAIYNIMFATPNLVHLSVQLTWTPYATASQIFDVPNGALYDSWNPRLQSITISGEPRTTAPFILSLLRHPRSIITSVHDVRFCRTWHSSDLHEVPQTILSTHISKTDCLDVFIDYAAIVIKSADSPGRNERTSWTTEWKVCSVIPMVRRPACEDTRTSD